MHNSTLASLNTNGDPKGDLKEKKNTRESNNPIKSHQQGRSTNGFSESLHTVEFSRFKENLQILKTMIHNIETTKKY